MGLDYMNNKYIWQDADLRNLTWQDSTFSSILSEVHLLRGKLLGTLSLFGFKEQNDFLLEALTEETVHSSAIEGERLNRDSVRSSVAKHLGLEYEGLPPTDHYIEGVVQIMIDATCHFGEPINEKRLFAWHAALFPTGQSGIYKIGVGRWRVGEEPMQVVSGAMGRQKVHYEAPPSSDVPRMMQHLFEWIENETAVIDPVVKAAVAHLWFLTIHPFDDGNGRLCRTITEVLLSRADKTAQRYYSLSSEILKHRKDYYAQLEKAQHGNTDITEWILWFLRTLHGALKVALEKTENTIRKVHFWDKHKDLVLNERQRKVLNMLLDGFDGKLNSSKWYKINHCSQDTAIRDLNDLVAKKILQKSKKGGRSTNYELTIE